MRDFAGVFDQIVGQRDGGMQAGDETSWMQRKISRARITHVAKNT